MTVQDTPTAVTSPATTVKVGIGRKTETIALTAPAVAKVKELLAAEPTAPGEVLALRVAVRPGGCAGFSYEMFFDAEIADDDLVKDYDGVKVVTDPASAQLLKGATLQYRDALQGGGFSIDNPNAQRSCGCGNSFG